MKRCYPLLCLFEHIFQCSLAQFCLALRQMIVFPFLSTLASVDICHKVTLIFIARHT